MVSQTHRYTRFNKRVMHLSRALACLLIAFLFVPKLQASGPADRILVVYNSNWTGDEDHDGVQDSLQVANYYLQKRGVPSDNLLGIPCTSDLRESDYTHLQSEVIQPIKTKLDALGPTQIDVILMCYRTPYVANNGSLDNILMGLNYWNPTTNNISWLPNPYLEPTPMIGADHGHFDHATYQFNGTTMYLVSRLDGPGGVGRILDLIDQARYADRYVAAQNGYFNGPVYIDSDGRGGSTDAAVWSNPDTQSGNYGSYAGTDANIAATEHYVASSGLTLKWQAPGGIIGTAGLKFTDGTSAATAPNALFYSGWYAYNTYLDVWDWLPGSVGTDLDSSSLGNLRVPNTFSWGTWALYHGATCICGVANEPYTTGHTRPNVLTYYLLQGYSFAEASALANPAIGWQSYAIGDPLYTPLNPNKELVHDTQSPTFSTGFPFLTQTVAEGSVIHVQVDDSPEPEVVRVQLDYGPTSNYGQTVKSLGSYRRHLLTFRDLPSGLIHYRITITDPAGNQTSTGDLTFTAPTQSPHGGTPWAIPGTIQAKDFDDGGEGVAYHDFDSSNNSQNQPRNDTGVEINTVSPYQVTGTYPGEWLEYSVNVAANNAYTLDENMSFHGGSFHIEIDGVNVTGAINPPASGSGRMTQTAVSVTAGPHILKLVMDRHGGGYDVGNFTSIRFTASDSGMPTITSLFPSSGTTLGGTPFTITGTSFMTGATVLIGGTNATNVVVNSASSISAVTPPGVNGAQDVTVNNPNGLSDTLPAGYLYIATPVLTAVNPNSGPTVGGTKITLTGTGFRSGATVQVGGTNATNITVVSGTSITATTPSGKEGPADVQVTNTDFQTTTMTNGFTFVALPKPTLVSITPTSGPTSGGTSVTLIGTNFSKGSNNNIVVYFGGNSVMASYINSNTLTASTPPGTDGACDVYLINGDGQLTNTLTDGYIYQDVPRITTQPSDQTVWFNQNATFTVTATGTNPLNYQWQSSSNHGGTWSNISGATSATYIFAPGLSENGNLYRCLISNSIGQTTSNTATLLVYLSATITTQPTDALILVGQNAEFSVGAIGAAPLVYQWQLSTDQGATWTDIAGAASFKYALFNLQLIDSGHMFRCVVTNDGGSTTSDSATLTVTVAPIAPSITQQPADQHVLIGQAATFSTMAKGTEPLSYRWQRSIDHGSLWQIIAGATDRVYSVSNIGIADDGNVFRCIATNSAGNAISDVATLTLIQPPTVTTQPANTAAHVGERATFKVEAAGFGPLTFQWQESTSHGFSWLDLADATSATYTTQILTAADDGDQLHCLITNAAGTTTSATAILSVQTPAGNSNPASGDDIKIAAYPNPFERKLHDVMLVKGPSGAVVDFFGVDGRLIHSLVLDDSGAGSWNLAHEDLTPGLYLFRGNSHGTRSTGAVVIH